MEKEEFMGAAWTRILDQSEHGDFVAICSELEIESDVFDTGLAALNDLERRLGEFYDECASDGSLKHIRLPEPQIEVVELPDNDIDLGERDEQEEV